VRRFEGRQTYRFMRLWGAEIEVVEVVDKMGQILKISLVRFLDLEKTLTNVSEELELLSRD
jgi:hypothetical protein